MSDLHPPPPRAGREDARRDPDALLARIRSAEEEARRARLKIFFGAAAGVGKTYAMLVEAHERKARGEDVVVGYVETHGRAETEALLHGLELLPRRKVEYNGVALTEFDLDAALARAPGLVLVDELAHTNVPGSRHVRRFQDVEELLAAGVDVYTTLNVQHVESLNDVVSQITGVNVRETVPDSLLERADEIECIDLPPDDLLARLAEGKVYVPEQARQATAHFFQKGNLIALRELALRQTALRVDAQMERYRAHEGIGEPWAVHGRILVAIGDAETGLRLVRAARALAAETRAQWIVAYVETPAALRAEALGKHDGGRANILDVLGLAEDLGAETQILEGLSISDELLAYAKSRNVARIVVGKPTRPRWRERLFGSLVNSLVRDSGPIDVVVMRGDDTPETEGARFAIGVGPRSRPLAYAGMLGAVALTSLVAWLAQPVLDPSNLVMVFLLGVLASAVVFGRGPGVLAAVLSVAIFDFFFVPPRLTFAVRDTQYLVTFAVMLVTALTVAALAARMRQQTAEARERERRTAALYRLSREMATRDTPVELVDAAATTVSSVLDGTVAILLAGADGRLAAAGAGRAVFPAEGNELGVAQWAYEHRRPAGRGTDTLPAAGWLYLPLEGTDATLGVIAISPARPEALQDPRRFHWIAAIASQVALALERAQLAAQAEAARVAVEAERLRNALLSAVSHDLRTPLAVITGSATTLRDEPALPQEERHELAASIAEEGERLNRLVSNLLDMTRLESGAVAVKKDWHSLEELVGAALGRLEHRLAGRPVTVRVPRDLPLVALDGVLVEQALFNLVDNALKYSPPGAPIEIAAALAPGIVRVTVSDRGPGIAAGQEAAVFEKFTRSPRAGDPGGIGLGLAIVKGIAEAHGGSVRVANRDGGGAAFTLELPRDGEPPALTPEAAS